MSKFLQVLALSLVTFIGVGASQAEVVYVPRAVQVTGPVYAIVGPLGQRSQANAGLNANYGFVLTANGVILIDSGASAFSAALLAHAVKMVTPKPIRWVLNTGSQDHRWLGNGYFAGQGAEMHALAGTVKTQQGFAAQQMANLQPFLAEQLQGTEPRLASKVHDGPEKNLILMVCGLNGSPPTPTTRATP